MRLWRVIMARGGLTPAARTQNKTSGTANHFTEHRRRIYPTGKAIANPRTLRHHHSAIVFGVHRSGMCRSMSSPLSSPSVPALGARRLPERRSMACSATATPRQHCPGCGIGLQGDDPSKPGFYQMPKQNSETVEQAYENEAAERESELGLGRSVGIGDPPATSEQANEKKRSPVVFCARCFSLRNYGKVKRLEVEELLPSFDVASQLCSRVRSIKGRRQVVLCVVDITDFDGSLPLRTLDKLFAIHSGHPSNRIELMLVANKVDLLPGYVTQQRLQGWVREQARVELSETVTDHLSSVHLVSAAKGRGVVALLSAIASACGPSGDLWVLGAQNAGKSSLINALRKLASPTSSLMEDDDGRRRKKRNVRAHQQHHQLTESTLPGTTLGFVRIDGILPSKKARTFDTPGIVHNFQLTSSASMSGSSITLTSEDIAMLLPRRQLKPRTFRCGIGYSVTIGGGLCRVDVVDAPGSSVYITLWASDEVSHHFGKTENADKILKTAQRSGSDASNRLVPPSAMDPDAGNANAVATDVQHVIDGTSWKKSSRDISIAGIGWIGIGVSGRCTINVRTPKGKGTVATKPRDLALIPDFAERFERPGFRQMLPKGKRS